MKYGSKEKYRDLAPLKLPRRYNYIGAFLTLACNLRCGYCINNFQEKRIRRTLISGKEWVRGLNRLSVRKDLPVTLQGGEPSLHPDFIYIINNLKPQLHIDILTNLQFDIGRFIASVDPDRLKRKSPYASIRVSFHPQTMDLRDTIEKTAILQKAGFHIGIWTVLHPKNLTIVEKAKRICQRRGIDFRTKEFLGGYRNKLYGTYKYKGACDQTIKGRVMCRTTELLIDCQADVYRCHSDLYAGRNPVGNILDSAFSIEDKFKECEVFGLCNPCDVKVKTNRFQQFGHTSVKIIRVR